MQLTYIKPLQTLGTIGCIGWFKHNDLPISYHFTDYDNNISYLGNFIRLI